MFHPLSILDSVPSAIALEMAESTLLDVLSIDASIWTHCSTARVAGAMRHALACPGISPRPLAIALSEIMGDRGF